MNVLLVTAIWPKPNQPAFGSFVHTQALALEREGINIDVMVLDGKPRKLVYVKAIWELQRRLHRSSFDLVHAHFGYVGIVARTEMRVPLVVTYHGSDVLGRIGPYGKPTPLSRAMATLGCAIGPLADAVIVQSWQMATHFRGDNVHIIPHEIDFETFRLEDRDRARMLLGLCPDRKYVLFAADPGVHVKRYPLARAAIDRLKMDDDMVELLSVYKEPQPRLALYMNACDALIFPSYQEGSPNVVKQSMACNLPIVATDVGDVKDVIGGTEGCYICNPHPSDFATRLRSILDTRQRTRGRDQVRRFECSHIARRVIDVYDGVLNPRCPVS